MILQVLPTSGESGSEVSYFILDPRNVLIVTRLSDDTNNPWIKETLKEIIDIFNNQTFLVQHPENGDPLTPCMDVYKA